jgi:TRAP-type C4-dicarboxylate transport system substrate-binding protein
MKTRSALATVSALAALVTAACTSVVDRSGGELDPTVLVLATNDDSQFDSALARFVQLVDQKSDGRLEIEVSDKWMSQGEKRVLEDVAEGQAPLGWSGTRAFDLVGVDSFRALHVPFLIASYAAQRAVVGDEVSEDMLAGLDGTGLTGLALLADELRFPAGAERPLLEADDYQALIFAVMESKTQETAMTALGARVTGLAVPDASTLDGVEGFETMWRTYEHNSLQRFAPFLTANAVLWPRTTAIVANTKALAALDEDDRDVLTGAASEAARWSLDHADDKVSEETEQACATGARIALASADELRSMRRASRPVHIALRSQPGQSSLLSRVEALVASAGEPEPYDVPDGCAYQPGDEDEIAVVVLPEALDGPGDPGDLPEGTYRYELTERDILDGVPGADSELAAGNAGVWTWSLNNGRWRYDVQFTAAEVPTGYDEITHCEGYYDVRGTRVDFTTTTVYPGGWSCASLTWKARWSRADGGLRMDVTTDGADLDFIFGNKPWERID